MGHFFHDHTYYAEPDSILSTRLTSLHCLWAKLNNRTRGQFERGVTWFCFCFDFVRSQSRYGCCSIFCLRFQAV